MRRGDLPFFPSWGRTVCDTQAMLSELRLGARGSRPALRLPAVDALHSAVSSLRLVSSAPCPFLVVLSHFVSGE